MGATTETRARALDGAGWLALAQSEYDESVRLLAQALALHEQGGDRRRVASSLEMLGVVAMEWGGQERARPLFEESLAIYGELGEPQAVSSLLNSLGLSSMIEASYPVAPTFEESLAIERKLNNREMVALALGNLGETPQHQGDLERATALYHGALRLQPSPQPAGPARHCLSWRAADPCSAP